MLEATRFAWKSSREQAAVEADIRDRDRVYKDWEGTRRLSAFRNRDRWVDKHLCLAGSHMADHRIRKDYKSDRALGSRWPPMQTTRVTSSNN